MGLQLASLILSVVEHFSKRLQTVLGMLEGCVKRADQAGYARCPKIGFVLSKRSQAAFNSRWNYPLFGKRHQDGVRTALVKRRADRQKFCRKINNLCD